MKSRIFKTCSYASTVFLLTFVNLYIYAQIVDPRKNVSTPYPSCPHISFGKICNATVTKELGGNVIFFNQEYYYSGSIISFAGDKSISETAWDGPGIYFRLIKDIRRPDDWWTLMFSFWYPFVIFSVLPLVFFIQKWRIARKT
jgi:hypothetical protein